MKKMLLLGTAATLLASSACSSPKLEEIACGQMPVGRTKASLVILTDYATPAFGRAISALVADPKPIFKSKRVGLKTKPGVVVVGVYNARGEVAATAAYNLGGVGNVPARRAANARQQGACLAEAVKAIPDTGEGGDLLRSLPSAAALGSDYSESKTAVVAFGFGRSSGDGFVVATTDFGTEDSRKFVLGELTRFSLVPNMSGVPVLLAAPTESLDSGITAAGVRKFASLLCTRLHASPCSAGDRLV